MPRGNMYLSNDEVRTVLAAVDSMLDTLPTGDQVPEVDRLDAENDRASYVQLRIKLQAHLDE